MYVVRHRSHGSLHALKLFTAATATASRRYAEEGAAQARIRHPNVVAVTDVMELPNQVGLVMECLEGSTLAEVLADDTPLSREDVLRLFSEVCAGVSAAHALGILHRDLKPSNVLLAIRDGVVTAKIADFGIARAAQETTSSTGTAGYMAPEQILDASSVDARTDVFSLGVLLYELLANQSPFTRAERRLTLTATLDGDHVPLGTRMPDLAPALVAAVERALAVDPGCRFVTVAHFERAVRAATVASDAAPPLAERIATVPTRVVRPAARPAYAGSPRVVAVASLPPGHEAPRPIPAPSGSPGSPGFPGSPGSPGSPAAPPARRSGAAPPSRTEPYPEVDDVTDSGPFPVLPLACGPRRGELLAREEARRRAMAESPRSVDRPQRKQSGLFLSIVAFLLLNVAAWQLWSVANAGASHAREAQRRLAELTAERVREWELDGQLIRSILRGSADPSTLNAAVEAYRLAPTPRVRATAGRQVVRAARVEIAYQRAEKSAREFGDAERRLDVIERDLYAWETVIDAEARTRKEVATQFAQSLGLLPMEVPAEILKVGVLAPIPAATPSSPVVPPVERRRRAKPARK